MEIRAAEIEADPAALEVTTQRTGRGALRRQVAGVNNGEGMIEDPLPDEIGVEAPGCRVAIVRRQLCRGLCRTVQVNAPSPARPEDELYEALEMRGIRRGLRNPCG